MGFAKRAGKSVFSAGAAALKSVIDGTNSGESANNTFSDVGMSFLDDTVSRTNEKNGKHQVLREGSQNGRDVSATSSTKMYNFAQHIRHRQRDMEGFKSRGRKIMHDE